VQVVLSGAERGASRKLLLANNVERLGVNLSQLHIPVRNPIDLASKFEGVEVWLYTSVGDEDLERFSTFVENYHIDIHTIIGRPDYDGKWLGDKYVPLWNDDADLERLAHLCETNSRVAVSDKALSKVALSRIQQLSDRWGTRVICITSKVDFISAHSWDSIIVANWTSVIKYGETQVWDGRTLKRYSKEQKHSARQNHRADIERILTSAEYSVDDVIEDNADALATLAIRSWLELEMAKSGAYTVDSGAHDGVEQPLSGHETGGPSNYDPSEMTPPNSGSVPSTLTNTPPQKRHEGEKSLLPLLSVETRTPGDALGDETLEEQGEGPRQVSVRVARSGQTLRQCDSCYLAARCPEYRGGHECGYFFPVRLESMDQLKSMVNLILEMQVERTMFAAFAEQLEGQGNDATVSKEFDRVFRMVEAIRNLNDDRDVFSLKVEARSGAGVIGRIFGEKVSDQMGQLPVPVDTNSVLEELGVIDAEVVDNDVQQ
jgi:hypothetical protein